MRLSKKKFLFAILFMSCNHHFAQCSDPSNIYTFVYEEHTYQVVKENKTWTEASICALENGGYLAEINNELEQDTIFYELVNNAGITISNTENQFGTASIWLGGSDAGTEGEWIWDGDNNGIGPQFWDGGTDGSPVDGLYTNWGISPAEPDNSGGQDHLTMIIKPSAINFSLWNDLISTNEIYYVIEHNEILSLNLTEYKPKDNLYIYPNPFKNQITIENTYSHKIKDITISTLMGQEVKTFSSSEIINNAIDLAGLTNGIYMLTVYFDTGESFRQQIVK